MKGAALVVLVASLLAACVPEVPPPQTSSPSVVAIPSPAAAGPLSEFSLGLVLGDGARATVSQLQATGEGIRSYGLFANTQALADTEPGQIRTDLLHHLGQRFRTVQMAETVDQALSRGDDLVLTVDVRTQLGASSGQVTSVTLGGRMTGRKGGEAAVGEARGQGVVPYPAFSMGFRSAWQSAMAQFMGQLDGSQQIADMASGRRGGFAARTRPASRPGEGARSPEFVFSRGGERPDDIAVVIGNSDYATQGRDIPDVEPAYADAEAARRYALEALGVREGNIIFLQDATGAQITRVFGSERDHRGQLYDWIKPGRSRVFIYYAGHGASGADGTSYLVPVDADGSRVELNGYPLPVFYRNLGQLPASEVTVVLEACFSGLSQAGAVLPRASGLYVRPRGVDVPANLSVIAAGAADQVASWEEDGSHGLFTRYFLEAMSGEADRGRGGNGDGVVSLTELRAYLDDTLTYFARRYYGRDQRAEIIDHGRPVN